jgi:hypothetical protein
LKSGWLLGSRKVSLQVASELVPQAWRKIHRQEAFLHLSVGHGPGEKLSQAVLFDEEIVLLGTDHRSLGNADIDIGDDRIEVEVLNHQMQESHAPSFSPQ